jgi:hypothetical protein
MNQMELAWVISLLIVSSLLVSGVVRLPSSVVLLLASPITKLVLVGLVLLAFYKSPLIGIAATVTLAVLLFSRNRVLVSSELPSLDDPAVVPDAYPIEQDRPEESTETRTYTFLPSADTGSDQFARFGPQLDEKQEVLSECGGAPY